MKLSTSLTPTLAASSLASPKVTRGHGRVIRLPLTLPDDPYFHVIPAAASAISAYNATSDSTVEGGWAYTSTYISTSTTIITIEPSTSEEQHDVTVTMTSPLTTTTTTLTSTMVTWLPDTTTTPVSEIETATETSTATKTETTTSTATIMSTSTFIVYNDPSSTTSTPEPSTSVDSWYLVPTVTQV